MEKNYTIPSFLDIVFEKCDYPSMDSPIKNVKAVVEDFWRRKDTLDNLIDFCLTNYPVNEAIRNTFKLIRFVSDLENDETNTVYFHGELIEYLYKTLISPFYNAKGVIVKYSDLPSFNKNEILIPIDKLFIGTPKDSSSLLTIIGKGYLWKEDKDHNNKLAISSRYFGESKFGSHVIHGEDAIKMM